MVSRIKGRYVFDVRVVVKAEDMPLADIKRYVKLNLAGDPGLENGFAVYSTAGVFEVKSASESRAYEVADWALKELESWTRSEYQGTAELEPRLKAIIKKRVRMGGPRD